ncbi:MAG: PEGA domain-containing protein [Planctomycetota bacterium]
MLHPRVALIAALLCAACQSARRPLVIDSDPPGALVLINGVDSGFATPCVLDLEERRVRTVELELAGYRTEKRVLKGGEWSQTMLWPDMTVGEHTWRFPLFLSFKDALMPTVESDGEMPNRIHARLVRERND